MCMYHTQCAASHSPDPVPACDPVPNSCCCPPAEGPAPSIPDLCHSSSQTTLSGEALAMGIETTNNLPEWKIMATVAVVQRSPFNLTALATIETPQGPRWEHTNALGLLIPGAVPEMAAVPPPAPAS